MPSLPLLARVAALGLLIPGGATRPALAQLAPQPELTLSEVVLAGSDLGFRLEWAGPVPGPAELRVELNDETGAPLASTTEALAPIHFQIWWIEAFMPGARPEGTSVVRNLEVVDPATGEILLDSDLEITATGAVIPRPPLTPKRKGRICYLDLRAVTVQDDGGGWPLLIVDGAPLWRGSSPSTVAGQSHLIDRQFLLCDRCERLQKSVAMSLVNEALARPWGDPAVVSGCYPRPWQEVGIASNPFFDPERYQYRIHYRVRCYLVDC